MKGECDMRNWKRRLLAMLLAMLMILPLLVACDEGEDPTPEGGPDDGKTESTEKEIDIYFIAGQSNAAGSTVIKNADEIYADYPELKTGTNPYILYAGNSAGNSPNNTVTYDWGSVKLGLGASSTKMGPEVGMAKELSKYYNAETGKVAGIIKYAHGGTGLANTEANGNRDGNWSPPSYSEHDPDDPDLAYNASLTAAIAMKITPTARRYTHQPADVKYLAVRRTVRITRAIEDTLNHVLLFA